MQECSPITTVKGLEELAQKIKEKRAEKEEKAKILSAVNEELDQLEQLAVRTLKELGKSSYGAEAGTITKVVKWRVNLPNTEEAKTAFFSYLKERGLFEKLATVNSNTLNSFFMEEWEAAKDPNDPMAALDFRLPGISEPSSYETLSFRKK